MAQNKNIRIALAGNPNSGKTTMFNYLTGSNQYVGNWPGVTVEKKEGKVKGYKEAHVVDLPGIYSLSPYTLEEVVTRNYLLDEYPDVVINIIDASNLERNLYLTTQIMEVGVPVVVALNMMDIVQKRGDSIDINALSEALGCPVLETAAVKGQGCKEIVEKAMELAQKNKTQNKQKHKFSQPLENILGKIEAILLEEGVTEYTRWYAVKCFELDEKAMDKIQLSQQQRTRIENLVKNYETAHHDDRESIIANARYEYIETVIQKCYVRKVTGMTVSDKIDRIITNRWLALPIFAGIMFLVYFISVSWLGTIATDWTNDVLIGEIVQGNVSSWLEMANAAPWLQGLLVDGIIGGVGAVIGFIPQICLLFFLLSILEDCGYMARVAFILDRLFRKIGLSGKSFIPLMVSTGCGVPGIMASRTIESERDRKMTIMVTTFIPCSAKLPIIAMIGGSLFGGSPWIAPSIYFLGIAMVVICGLILKHTNLFIGDSAPFVMELPNYHLPRPKGVLLNVWDKAKSFLKKAGTVIFVSSVLLWFLSNFSWQMQMVDTQESMLAAIGGFIAPIFAPLGFNSWEATVATLTGFIAKENVVATFGILLGVGESALDDPATLLGLGAVFSTVSAYAFLAFNMICAPCLAAIGAIKKEMGSWKWMLFTITFQTVTAYLLALLIFQVGSAIFLQGSIVNAVISICIVAAIITGILVYSKIRRKKHYAASRAE